jgi:hypothetical protein
MINDSFVVKYSGMDADQHRLPAYEAGVSIQGIARSVTMVTAYLATGRIRRNAPFDSEIDVFIRPLRPGSLDTVYQIVSQVDPVITLGNITLGVTSIFIYDTKKLVFNRVTGHHIQPQSPELLELERLRRGDISALEDAVEPALVQAHRIIGAGSNNIVIFGDHNRIVFNGQTKEYINASEVEQNVNQKRVSIASYNANQRTGRLYDFEFQKTVPFSLARDASQKSAVAIARSLTRYAGDQDSNLEIVFQKVVAPDSRIKKYIISRATIARIESDSG